MKKPVRKKKKVTKSESDRQWLMKKLEVILGSLHSLDSAQNRFDRINVENRIAARVGEIEKKVERILELAERDSSDFRMLTEKLVRIEWVHLMLAKVISPLLFDVRHASKTADIAPHIRDEIRQMALRAEKAGIDG